MSNDPVKAATGAGGRGSRRLAARGLAPTAVLGALLTCAVPATRAQCPPVGAAVASLPSGITCREDDALRRLFTPRAAPSGTYRTWVTSVPLPRIAQLLRAHAPGSDAAGRWAVQDLEPLDAFGDGGPYDRTMLARLYVGKRARVARGPVVENGRAVSSLWLISPYPDASLSRLDPGTLIIEFRLGGLDR